MDELNYTLYIDESGVSSNKLSYYREIEKRNFFALGSLKAQKNDIDEFYNKYLKQFEIKDEIKRFFHDFCNMFDKTFFNLLDELFKSEKFEQYEKAYKDLIPFLVEKQIMSEKELLDNFKFTKQLLMEGTYNIENIKPLGNQYNVRPK